MKLNSSDKLLIFLTLSWNALLFPTMMPDEHRQYKETDPHYLPKEYRHLEHALGSVTFITFFFAVLPARVLYPFYEWAVSKQELSS